MTTEELSCPTCAEPLNAHPEDTFRCVEDHQYTVVGLALTTNIAALRALWMAIRALEDDAHSLNYLASHYGDAYGLPATTRRAEATAALEAADLLRTHARRAQDRLDALPTAPSGMRDDHTRPGPGG